MFNRLVKPRLWSRNRFLNRPVKSIKIAQMLQVNQSLQMVHNHEKCEGMFSPLSLLPLASPHWARGVGLTLRALGCLSEPWGRPILEANGKECRQISDFIDLVVDPEKTLEQVRHPGERSEKSKGREIKGKRCKEKSSEKSLEKSRAYVHKRLAKRAERRAETDWEREGRK